MKRALLVAPVVLLAACGGDKPAKTPGPAPEPSPSAAPSGDAGAASADAAKPSAPKAAQTWSGLKTPESVLWDAANDRYLVSNINGSPTEADDNGYISVLSPDGSVTTEKWIAGGEKKVKLDAPKGTAIANGKLYVADITVVRTFDLKTGEPKGDVKVPGATFLNDVSAAADGTVYVSDTGMKLGKNGPEALGTDAIYAIDKAGKLKTVAKDKELHMPNGVLAKDKGVLVVCFGAPELYRLDEKGKKQDVTTLPKGRLDGIVQAGDALLVSSWEASAIFKGKLGGAFEPWLTEQKAPADIGFDEKRSRVLVPHFMDGTVEAWDVK